MQGQDKLISGFPVDEETWPLWSRLKAGFLLLIVAELLLGFAALTQADWISGLLPDAPIVGQHLSAGILFFLIVLGTVFGGLLFWMLGNYVIRSRALLDQISDGICVTDRDWRVFSCNKSFSRIIGVPAEEITGTSIFSLMPGCSADKAGGRGQQWDCEFEGQRASGERYCAQLSVLVLATENGEPTRCLITLRDTTELKKSQQHIQKLAFEDELTGLANRSQFQRRLLEAISRARRSRASFSVLFLDLDGFKDINDGFGHDAGDIVLQAVGQRLAASVRNEDLVARFGGDEFCMILENIHDQQQAASVAQRCLHEIGKPLEVCDYTLRLRGSIGIAVFPRDGGTQEAILQAADTAMYAAKHGGKDSIAFFTHDLTVAAERRLSLEHDLREAIEKGQFALVYQPQISLHSGELTGVEALIRWHHPERGMVRPDEFIEVAERIGIINELGDWVIETACRQAREWIDAGLPEFRVSVNISGSHFRSPDLVNTVKAALAQYALPASRIELEVTEGVMQTGGESVEIFRRIKALGVRIAIDDFGTGYSSLASLKKLPLDCLKIDKEFVHDMLDKNEHAVIIATIVGMAQALGMEVIVEGVEHLQEMIYLRGLNCDTVQGYFFSKPVPAADIPALAQKDFLRDAACATD